MREQQDRLNDRYEVNYAGPHPVGVSVNWMIPGGDSIRAARSAEGVDKPRRVSSCRWTGTLARTLSGAARRGSPTGNAVFVARTTIASLPMALAVELRSVKYEEDSDRRR